MLDSPDLEPRPSSYVQGLRSTTGGALVVLIPDTEDGEPCVRLIRRRREWIDPDVLGYHLHPDPHHREAGLVGFAISAHADLGL